MRRSCVIEGCGTRARDGDFCIRHCPELYHRAYLPSEPLVALVEARGGVTGCGADKSLRRAYSRAKKAGKLTEMQADRLALQLLRLHPWEVWDCWFPASVT